VAVRGPPGAAAAGLAGRGDRPGHPKRLTDAELVCLAVAQVLLGARSEHHWLRLCYGRLGHLFPYLPRQPGYHKRLKAAAPLLAAAIDHLALQSPGWYDQVRLIDATPVPCGASRETVKRSDLAGWGGYGYCAAHSRWYAAAGRRSDIASIMTARVSAPMTVPAPHPMNAPNGPASIGQGLGAGLWVRGSGQCWQFPQPGEDLGKQVVAGR